MTVTLVAEGPPTVKLKSPGQACGMSIVTFTSEIVPLVPLTEILEAIEATPFGMLIGVSALLYVVQTGPTGVSVGVGDGPGVSVGGGIGVSVGEGGGPNVPFTTRAKGCGPCGTLAPEIVMVHVPAAAD